MQKNIGLSKLKHYTQTDTHIIKLMLDDFERHDIQKKPLVAFLVIVKVNIVIFFKYIRFKNFLKIASNFISES